MHAERPYHGGGGRRRYKVKHTKRGNNDFDYHDRGHRYQETPEQKIRDALIKLGDFMDPMQEIREVAKHIRAQQSLVVPVISEGFRVGVTEQPYKIPYYAALLHLLHERDENSSSDNLPIGRQILEDFWKGFQTFLDNLAWRETRLCIHFFAHLTLARIVSTDTMISLLQAFTSVLDEFGVSFGRAKKATLCAAEGLMIGGSTLKTSSASAVTEIINAIQAYSETTTTAKWLVQPSPATDIFDEELESILLTLQGAYSNDFVDSPKVYQRPYSTFPPLDPSISRPFDLPSVLVPPEVIELDNLSSDSGEEAQVKREEWPEFYLRLFPDEVSPSWNTLPGHAVRSGILDVINIFEVNRKECARLLLEYPKWTVPGTFKPKQIAGSEPVPVEGYNWELESTIIETILGAYFLLPESNHKPIYYTSLITEICKLSPTTVGPAVGKSIRKLYNGLEDGLDVEVSRRFAEWFAVHMSNFGFQWVWKEWIPDLELEIQHPKRSFIRRALEFEIRLSYHDRIIKTLPEPMQAAGSHTISEQAPGPDFEYEDPAKPHHDAAGSILNLFRGRAKAEDVISQLENMKSTLETAEGNVDGIIRSITVQSLLNIGSRSFSHLLNAIERYLPLLRYLATGDVRGTSTVGNAEAKADILTAAAAFWKLNRHMVGIVFNKLMQYQIVDPTDVVVWTFTNGAEIGSAERSGSASLDLFEWDLLKGALDKANGRVMIARRKVMQLRKEEDEKLAKAKAGDVNSMEVEGETKQEETPTEENPALTTALKAFASLTREQKMALSRTMDGFISCLAMGNPSANKVVREVNPSQRGSWTNEDWTASETWGWYKQFCRAYSPYLRNYQNTLGIVSFAKIEGSAEQSAQYLRKIWNVAIGQE